MKVTKNQVCKSSFSDHEGVLKFDAYTLLHTCINIKTILIATVH